MLKCARAIFVLIAGLASVVGCTGAFINGDTHESLPVIATAPILDVVPEQRKAESKKQIPSDEGTSVPHAWPLPIHSAPTLVMSIHGLDLTVPPEDLWDRIRRGFAIPDLDSPLVQKREDWYVGQAAYFARMIERSKLYLYHIVDALEERGMPMELALLPMVESAFDPFAYSSANASGLWQFVPATGKEYDLQQDRWYDERRDVVASTASALDYLEHLYEIQGDWQLALASYNWGENAVLRAIEKKRVLGLPNDYSNLSMPRETRDYLPKLQALENIISNPSAFGIDLDSIPDQPYFGTVPIRDIDLQVAADLAEMSLTDLIALNPGHKLPVLLAKNSKVLVLPLDRVDVFKANLSRRTRPLVTWQSYKLKRGDKLSQLAAAHGISLSKLKQLNGIPRSARIKPGMELLLPTKEGVLVLANYSPPSKAPASRKIVYKVKKGDTLWGISRRYSVSVHAIRSWNSTSPLKTGQKIVIYTDE